MTRAAGVVVVWLLAACGGDQFAAGEGGDSSPGSTNSRGAGGEQIDALTEMPGADGAGPGDANASSVDAGDLKDRSLADGRAADAGLDCTGVPPWEKTDGSTYADGVLVTAVCQVASCQGEKHVFRCHNRPDGAVTGNLCNTERPLAFGTEAIWVDVGVCASDDC